MFGGLLASGGTQLWRTVKLGEEVENKGFGARDRPAKSELERTLARRPKSAQNNDG